MAFIITHSIRSHLAWFFFSVIFYNTRMLDVLKLKTSSVVLTEFVFCLLLQRCKILSSAGILADKSHIGDSLMGF